MGTPKNLQSKIVAGVDEAGRGAWAGPVVAAAVVWPQGVSSSEINDSKQLTPLQREQLFLVVEDKAQAIGVGIVSHEEVDEWGVGQATRVAMQRAVDDIDMELDLVMVDGYRVGFSGVDSIGVIKGDSKYISIAAASIIAKVTRDRLMIGMHAKYPRFGFAVHKGYGTQLHRDRLDKYGVCRIHRRSFEPVRKLLEKSDSEQDSFAETSIQS